MTRPRAAVRRWRDIPLSGRSHFPVARSRQETANDSVRGPTGICGIFVSQTARVRASVSSAVAPCLAAALASGLTMSAHAGDAGGQMPLKAAVAPAPYYGWAGFYVGGHVAYSLGRADSTLSDPAPTPSSNAFGSLYGGLQAGYNYVLPSRVLLGIEADITFPYFFEDGTIFTGGTARGSTISDQIDYIATLRGRFGYAFDRWLIYATGGLAWSQARFGETPGVASDEDLVQLTRVGSAIGLGAELAIAPDWTARSRISLRPLRKRRRRLSLGHGVPVGVRHSDAAARAQLQARRGGRRHGGECERRSMADRTRRLECPRPIHGHRAGLSGLPLAVRRSEQPRRRQPSQGYGELHRIHRRSCVGRRRHLHQSGDHPRLRAERYSWARRLPQLRSAKGKFPDAALQPGARVCTANVRSRRRAGDHRGRSQPTGRQGRHFADHHYRRQARGHGLLRQQRLCPRRANAILQLEFLLLRRLRLDHGPDQLYVGRAWPN